VVTSKSINALAAALLLSLSGCTTLKQHPVLTAIGTAIIVGSIAALAQQHHHDRRTAGPCGDGRTIHPEAPYYGDCH
jgi:hypothetical protein